MRVGLIGAGNIARAFARGWDDPLLVSDALPERARALAAEVGGEAVDSNAELAERADLVLLCHKPAGLQEVAAEVAPAARAVASVLAGRTVSELEAAYPGRPVFRFMPNTPIEIARGVLCYARQSGVDSAFEAEVVALFRRVGRVVALPEHLIDVAMGLQGVGPAYVALIVEAWVDAGVRRGLSPEQASELAVETVAGSAELLRARDADTFALRRAVTSPGGATARGVAALERAGVRAAFHDALDAVLAPAP